ncbi:olfactory receptor 5AR1-like [Hyperolius riggenbachi]|uniref:olfactory receptor 5AR1-like n=1 Tax=Hyperolius riggenbachi TaxID=752182 RepID=UPI0035A271C3
MDTINQANLSHFVIQGISDVPQLQVLIFLLILLFYILTLAGNTAILLLVCLNKNLHTPMYFFLGNLAVLDMSSSTITLHKPLAMFITGNKKTPFSSCMTQVYFFSSFTSNELLILTAMSYDRYIAICRPLHYTLVMKHETCLSLSLLCWLLSFLEIIPYIVLLLKLSCYKSNIINHFFCDIVPVMKLSCSDTSALEVLIFTEGVFLLSFTPFFLTCISYVFIIVTVTKIPTSLGRRKAFYTCSSHLMVVALLYVTLFCQYLRPASQDTLDSNKMFSLFNTAAVPVLNPIIYSLKNKDVKSAAKRTLARFKG